jgi:hypothetical protein
VALNHQRAPRAPPTTLAAAAAAAAAACRGRGRKGEELSGGLNVVRVFPQEKIAGRVSGTEHTLPLPAAGAPAEASVAARDAAAAAAACHGPAARGASVKMAPLVGAVFPHLPQRRLQPVRRAQRTAPRPALFAARRRRARGAAPAPAPARGRQPVKRRVDKVVGHAVAAAAAQTAAAAAPN